MRPVLHHMSNWLWTILRPSVTILYTFTPLFICPVLSAFLLHSVINSLQSISSHQCSPSISTLRRVDYRREAPYTITVCRCTLVTPFPLLAIDYYIRVGYVPIYLLHWTDIITNNSALVFNYCMVRYRR